MWAYLKRWCGEKHMGGLDHVSRVDVIVVGYVSMVILLQSHHEGDKSVCGDLEGLQKVSLLARRAKVKSRSVHISPKHINTIHIHTVRTIQY